MRIGSRRPRRGVTGTTRWVGRGAVMVGMCCITLGVIAPPAGANYGRITAEARCDRTVAWTASASTEGSADERTNTEVTVDYRAADSDDPWTSAGAAGSFVPSNNFTFAGSFPLPDGVERVEVRVSPEQRWGSDRDRADPGTPRFTSAAVPAECAEQPLVVTISADCDAGGATVVSQNLGASAASVSVTVDQILVREVPLAPGATASVIVPVLEGTRVVVRATAESFMVAERTVSADCAIPGPAATITERCGARQAVVQARSDADEPAPVEITVADAVVHRVEVDPDEVVQRTIELPPTGPVEMVVTVGGTTVARGLVGGCTGPITGAVSCGTAGRPVCELAVAPPAAVEAPPPPPPPLVIDLEQGTLPVTGPWQRALALLAGGALLVGGGGALVLEQRRRPRPSLLASLVSPYRQRWWKDLSDS